MKFGGSCDNTVLGNCTSSRKFGEVGYEFVYNIPPGKVAPYQVTLPHKIVLKLVNNFMPFARSFSTAVFALSS